MTLGRQLAAAISVLFLVALVGVEAIHLRRAQGSLQQQLESLAQDAATSLGLSLGVLLGSGDAALAETVINPAFDRGHYERIEYLSAGGERVVSRHLPASEGRYPAWFVRAFPLHAPTAESLVSAGWRQAGRVRVTVHPRFAYEQLWTTARDTGTLLLIVYAAALLVLRLVLRGVLRPLAEVEKAAQAISERRFVTLRQRPKTRELARVVEAINSLSLRVGEALEAETRRAERLQAAAYQDPVTGLPNALGFGARFESVYEGEDEPFAGVLALVEIAELGAINRALGSERCDALLRDLLRAMEEEAVAAGGFAGRWGGGVAVLALPRMRPERARELLAGLRAKAQATLAAHGVDDRERVHCGGIEAADGRPQLQALLRGAQDALRNASGSIGGVIVFDADRTERAAGDDRAAPVREAIAQRRLRLLGQPVYRVADHRTLHTEITARLLDAGGREMSAAQFVPVVAAQKLAEALDRAVIEKVVGEAKGGHIAVNVSPRSLEEPGFLAWLAQLLARHKPLAARLSFEVAEHGVVRNEAAAAEFAGVLRSAGAAFAIDHFGVHRDCLALLQRLQPAYVKLAGVQVRRAVSDAGARFFAESVVRAARQLEIPVIAIHVEDEAVFQEIASMDFNGYQGHLGGTPGDWP